MGRPSAREIEIRQVEGAGGVGGRMAVQTPVAVAGVLVHPGDILVADDDGAVIVPAARWDEVAELARRVDRVEDDTVRAVRAGAALAAARAAHGHHALQTRKDPS
ncbi:hypothetical protein [Streptomyces fuscichromogenes]|uniref:Oxaloacetate decarboxylase n=1 Tax=Streptomyces fuscichromogenes TaxID=1324013 RepID=A0A917XKI6_9ACTN|nr:hypothetical protein GCM10011578_070440 [Streptomyces fuscichromogenes]